MKLPKNSLFVALFCLLVSLANAPSALAQTVTITSSSTTADFEDVKQEVKELVEKHGGEGVLVVVDIDNTLLAMNQDLGSDQWFGWQEELLECAPESPNLVAKDFAGLLEVQGTLFSLSAMHPPEPGLPEMIREIQFTGVRTVVLTSRGYSFRDAAERELGRNKYDFSKSALTIDEKRGLFKPYDASEPDAHGLDKDIIFDLGSPRSVTYSNGIFMTAGQHKGYMLKTLLARSPQKDEIKAIVFVDDHEKHTKRMLSAFEGEKDLAVFHYTREAGNVANFNDSSKRHVVEEWNQLKKLLDRIMVK